MDERQSGPAATERAGLEQSTHPQGNRERVMFV
jgi:hypothetical protein